jgi:hypothetical protein
MQMTPPSWHKPGVVTIARRLSQASSVLQRYFNRWKLRVNIHKTEAILFTHRWPATPIHLRFQHARIPWKSQIRFFALLLDHKFLFMKHLTIVTDKATGSMVKLFPLLTHDSTLPAHNKLTLYKMSIRSVMTYAAPVWSNTSSSNYRACKHYSQNASESLVTSPDAPPFRCSIPPSMCYHFTSKFII